MSEAKARLAFKLEVARRALKNAIEYRDQCAERLRLAEAEVHHLEAEVANPSPGKERG